MDQRAIPYEKVLLVCKGGSCADCKCKKINERLKSELAERGLKKRVKIQKVDCLGYCKQAPNVMVLPDNLLFSNLRPKEVSLMLDELFAAEIVVAA